LESEGFVERHLNRGYYVHEMDEQEVAELCDAREAIEIFLLDKAIGNLTKSHVKELEEIARYHQEAEYTGIRKRIIIDGTFHLKITEASGSKYLTSLLLGLFSRLYLTYRLDKLPPQRKITAENEHSKILKAIKDKNTKVAKNLLQQHIRDGKKILIESLQGYLIKSVSN
ncbi:MAG: GntR family transcriptional regulator, partial [Pseudomonadota bacterium]